MHVPASFFDRWYMAAFLVIWGASLIIRARTLNDIRDNFDDDCRPEFKAVVERRQRLEARPIATWYVSGASSIVLGVATLFAMLNGGLAYALACTILVATLAAGYLRMSNSGPRRAAALVPRRIESVIAWPWYPAGIATALSPLVFIDEPSQRVAAVLASLSALTIMLLAVRANGMAALLTGENADLELYVDEWLRCRRVNAFWTVGLGVPFVYVVFAATSAGANSTLLAGAAFYFVIAVFLVRYWPLFAGMLRRLVLPWWNAAS